MSRYFDLMQQEGISEGAFASNGTKHAAAELKTPTAVKAAAEVSEHRVYQSQSSAISDEVLDLVQRVFLVPAENAPRVVVFAGVDEKQDVSQTCASVAETLARVSKRPVCIVEANFRSPDLHSTFGASNRHGLVDALTGDEPISRFCQPLAQENLWLLSSGAIDASSPSLLTPEGLKTRFAELRDAFEFIIVDSAPLARYAETMILGRVADGLALVLEAGSTRREAAAATIANLRAVNIPIVAAVLNKTAPSTSKKFFA